MFRTIAATLVLAVPAGAETGRTFFDSFDEVSESRWFISDGWLNGGHQNCTWTDEAIAASDSVLSVGFLLKPFGERSYGCGELQTREKFSYGVFEARLKTPTGSGLNAAFFTYVGPPNSPRHDEIDVEILLANTSQVSLNTYVGARPVNGGVATIRNGTSDSAYHIYSVIWQPSGVHWYVDGELVHRAGGPVPREPQSIFFSLWGSDTLDDWMGPFQRPHHDLYMSVDWVAYTKLGEPCQFPESVLCSLKK